MSLLHTANPDKKKAPDLGREAEKLTQAWLEARAKKQYSFAYHRFPDSKAARGALAAQPSDFLAGQTFPDTRKVAYMLEVKATAQKTTLPKDKVSQFGKLLMFYNAGFEVFVLVWRHVVGDWVVLTGADLFATDIPPKSFALGHLKSYPTHAEALTEIFQ